MVGLAVRTWQYFYCLGLTMTLCPYTGESPGNQSNVMWLDKPYHVTFSEWLCKLWSRLKHLVVWDRQLQDSCWPKNTYSASGWSSSCTAIISSLDQYPINVSMHWSPKLWQMSRQQLSRQVSWWFSQLWWQHKVFLWEEISKRIIWKVASWRHPTNGVCLVLKLDDKNTIWINTDVCSSIVLVFSQVCYLCVSQPFVPVTYSLFLFEEISHMSTHWCTEESVWTGLHRVCLCVCVCVSFFVQMTMDPWMSVMCVWDRQWRCLAAQYSSSDWCAVLVWKQKGTCDVNVLVVWLNLNSSRNPVDFSSY